MSEEAVKTLEYLDFQLKENFWSVKIGSYDGKWRVSATECLGDRPNFDVINDSLELCLELIYNEIKEFL